MVTTKELAYLSDPPVHKIQLPNFVLFKTITLKMASKTHHITLMLIPLYNLSANILKRKLSFNPSLIPPIILFPTMDLDTPYVNPLRKNKPPNVTINEGIFALTTINP